MVMFYHEASREPTHGAPRVEPLSTLRLLVPPALRSVTEDAVVADAKMYFLFPHVFHIRKLATWNETTTEKRRRSQNLVAISRAISPHYPAETRS